MYIMKDPDRDPNPSTCDVIVVEYVYMSVGVMKEVGGKNVS
jgi:hypothetical protein